jgi:hypothetical protein
MVKQIYEGEWPMISLADLKKNINMLLISKTGYKVYGREVQNGFDRPSFFVEFLLTGSDFETQNFTSNKLTVNITYFQVERQDRNYSDLENIKIFESLRNLIGMDLQVGTRVLHPQNFRMNYMGENQDIMQMSFDLDYLDTTDRQRDTEETASTLEINLNLGGN